MTNADKFKSLFGIYATELWSMPEKDFLKWLNSEAMNCSEFLNNSDSISRKAAIDALDVLCQEHRYRIPGKRETYSQYNEAWQDALGRAENAIGNLPSVQPERKWIPCSERLPETPYGCLVTVWDTDPITMDEFENILPYFVGWDGEQWNDGEGEQCPFEVIAWMPLPEPYREGEQDENR